MNDAAGHQNPESHGVRQAALLVHSMQDVDRAWILKELVPHQRAQIEVLLTELRELEIPQDPEILQLALRTQQSDRAIPQAKGTSAPLTPKTLDEFILFFDALDPHSDEYAWPQLCNLLEREPAHLLAILLDMHPWTWTTSALSRIPEIKRHRVMNAMSESGDRAVYSQMLAAALLRNIHAHLLSASSTRHLPRELHASEQSLRSNYPWHLKLRSFFHTAK
ncbi:hypothetical protein ACN9MJ_12975 [Acidovorax facilis]|uniref:hypothetical protein n=1 Tax=Acidovorax facilis TaxID=12917 RepID=UPI003CE6DF4B